MPPFSLSARTYVFLWSITSSFLWPGDGQQLLLAVCLSVAATFFLAMTMVCSAPVLLLILLLLLLVHSSSSCPALEYLYFIDGMLNSLYGFSVCSLPLSLGHSLCPASPAHFTCSWRSWSKAALSAHTELSNAPKSEERGRREKPHEHSPGPTHCFGRIKAPLLLPPPIGAWSWPRRRRWSRRGRVRGGP